MNQSAPRTIVIIGGVAGGASAAARLRRLDEFARIILLERGPDVSFANCGLPYYIGGEIASREALSVQTPESLAGLLGLDVRTRTEAIAIDRQEKRVRVRNLEDDSESFLTYDKLILAPGAEPIRPPLPGIDDSRIHTLRNLQDTDRIYAASAMAEDILVVGAGFIGLEMAEQFVHRGKRVQVVELLPQVLPQLDPEMARYLSDTLHDKGVGLVLGDGISGFETGPEKVVAHLASGRTIAADLVILSIGVRPESGLAREAGLKLGARGHVVVDDYLRTSDPEIYAVGDVVEHRDPVLGHPAAVPLGGLANRQGRIVADHIVHGGKARPYLGSLGTSIVRVFDAVGAVTGWTAKRLEKEGIAFEQVAISSHQHASYFPGADLLSVKILWKPEDGRLLGAQVVGREGVDKRIDVLATAILGSLSVADLCDLELAYAPPFGAAKDPVNLAGFAAMNFRDGLLRPLYHIPEYEGVQIVDVRPPVLFELQPVPGAVNIPFGQLRSRLGEIDKTRPVITVCALGKTSYFAARILAQHGFDVSSVIGGVRVHRDYKALAKPPTG